jgi:hypothetical protein
MVKIINKVEHLKENKNNLIDMNSIINEVFDNILSSLNSQLNSGIIKNKAQITVIGTPEKYSFQIISEDEVTIKTIENLIENK